MKNYFTKQYAKNVISVVAPITIFVVVMTLIVHFVGI